ncbi:hypothetical protein EIN_403350 [Entamoeba invadens IP1]|uniref:Uncharacterized protein n=1 Tax=Entamoeba invadens IP1 TaxID=370355 RepID=A0A0A1UA31_ENTIV|nr:hypothetical protein EIN_403350 [Entamoeba invadens IP1]ELP90011.1 hypothetical protein EIN_403350 [Entamoeba invadens IP1]|eukprot:XP_004256782.1 hypothetical protein EIN_403350 [Entamoeba invadens IP1]
MEESVLYVRSVQLKETAVVDKIACKTLKEAKHYLKEKFATEKHQHVVLLNKTKVIKTEVDYQELPNKTLLYFKTKLSKKRQAEISENDSITEMLQRFLLGFLQGETSNFEIVYYLEPATNLLTIVLQPRYTHDSSENGNIEIGMQNEEVLNTPIVEEHVEEVPHRDLSIIEHVVWETIKFINSKNNLTKERLFNRIGLLFSYVFMMNNASIHSVISSFLTEMSQTFLRVYKESHIDGCKLREFLNVVAQFCYSYVDHVENSTTSEIEVFQEMTRSFFVQVNDRKLLSVFFDLSDYLLTARHTANIQERKDSIFDAITDLIN